MSLRRKPAARRFSEWPRQDSMAAGETGGGAGGLVVVVKFSQVCSVALHGKNNQEQFAPIGPNLTDVIDR